MAKLPVYNTTTIPDDDRSPCSTCILAKRWDDAQARIKCKQAPLVRYDKKGSIADVNHPVDLLVVAEAPTDGDNSNASFFSDKDGKDILESIKSLGVGSFAVIPSVRCYPCGQVDHFILDKKYRDDRFGNRGEKKPLDYANDAVKKCDEYVKRARTMLRPKVTLAMGSLATAALGMGSNIIGLRSTPMHPNPGIAAAATKEGTVVTWDRAYSRVSDWAAADMYRDIEEKLPSLMKTGYATPRGDRKTIEVTVLDTVDLVEKFVDACLNDDNIPPGDFLSFDFETDNLEMSKEKNRILNAGFSFRSQEDFAYVVPMAHPATPFSGPELEEVYRLLGKLFAGHGAKFAAFLAHNAQFETTMIKLFFDVWLGEPGGVPIIDTQILAFLHNENRHRRGITKPYSLETLAREYLGFRWYAETAMKARRDKLASEPLDIVNEYVGIDAAVTSRLCNQIMEWMDEEESQEDLMRVATKLYSPAILYTTDMTMSGQLIDTDLLRKLRAPDSSIVHRLAEIESAFAEHKDVAKAMKIVNANKGGAGAGGVKARFKSSASAKENFSLASPVHRKALFWDVLKIKGADKSVDKEWQERNINAHPLVELFSEYQSLSKLDNAYLEPIAVWLQKDQSADGRLRPRFNLSKAATGRLSSSEPNTQQQPRGDTKDKKQIKSLFCAPPGKVLVQLDFSQAEVRWLGVIAEDAALAEKYATAEKLKERLKKDPDNQALQRELKVDGDLHMSTALDMYNLPRDLPFTEPDKAKKRRQAAKSVCFGLIYGKHYKSLARDLGIEEDDAEEAMDKWLGRFPGAAKWLKTVDETIGTTCIARSPFGRWRRLPEAKSNDVSVANRAKRQARNTPIQSAASDFCIYAACKLRAALQSHPDPRIREIKLINTVHDSLYAEVVADPEVLWMYANLAKAIFIDPELVKEDFGITVSVPFAVDFEIGLNLGNMHDFDMTEEGMKKCLYDAELLRSHPPGTVFSDLKGKGLLYAELGQAPEGTEEDPAESWQDQIHALFARYLRLCKQKNKEVFSLAHFHKWALKKGMPDPEAEADLVVFMDSQEELGLIQGLEGHSVKKWEVL